MARYLNTMDGLITFILHNQSLYENVKAIIHFKNEFIKCKEPYKRITDMLDSKYITGGYYIPSKKFDGIIEFKNLKFKYEKSDTYILDNFNFTIDSGEKISSYGQVNMIIKIYMTTKEEIIYNEQFLLLSTYKPMLHIYVHN